jgi:hypothetical protein
MYIVICLSPKSDLDMGMTLQGIFGPFLLVLAILGMIFGALLRLKLWVMYEMNPQQSS